MEAGIKNEKSIVVTEDVTASKVGSGLLPVYATPSMIALMEGTCAESVQSELAEGEGTVGVSVDIKHIAATPIGMKGFMADQMPLERVDLDKLNLDTVIYDIVYNPVKTVLIQEAQKRGLKTIGGLDMLIYQAERAIQIWTGKNPDTKLMKIAALEALQ